MDDIRISQLLETEKTPFYVFDLDELLGRVRFLRRHLPDKIKLCYAVKANTFILKEISSEIDRLEICSPGELRICQKLKLPTEKFVISGVYKEASVMEQLISDENTAGYFTVESMSQFKLLYEAAVKKRKTINLLLRLTSGNQFGLEEHEIEKLIDRYKNDSYVAIRGIQYFSGTQKNSLKRLRREIEYVDSYLKKLNEQYDFNIDELEFGPGFPAAYFVGEDFDEVHFMEEFSSMISDMSFRGKIVLELGRSIAASCGTYVTKVVDTKTNHGQNYGIVDGGMNHIVYYGQSMAMKHPVLRKLFSAADDNKEKWNICGSLCTVNDILVKQFPLCDLHVGDVLIFENTGAYCMTEGISLFLSRDLPEVILLKNNEAYKVVRSNVPTDCLNTPLEEILV